MKFIRIIIPLFVLLIGCGGGQVKEESAQVAEKKELKVLSFETLLENSTDIHNQEYKGTYYPVRIWGRGRLSSEVQAKVGENNKLVMLTNDSSNQRLLLIYPESRIEAMKGIIKNHEKFSFVYKPGGLFTKRMPLLKYISNLAEVREL